MDEKRDSIQFEIVALKSLLTDSDYQLLKMIENLTDCNNITSILAVFKNFFSEFGDLVKSRREWREKINELEAELEALEDAAPEGNTATQAESAGGIGEE